ncbi:MAG TPA: hypothetical protein VM118_14975 [Acidobacteriota bacterium]|nr:hypothetical protein [Acidobacteriota bacterium]
MNSRNVCTRRTLAGAVMTLLLVCAGVSQAGQNTPPANPTETRQAPPPRVACWLADGHGMRPSGELERFLVDRLGASGDRIAIEPGTTHAVLRLLGLSERSVFDPAAASDLARAAEADWVLWVKVVARDVRSAKGFSFPYLLNRRRLDAHVFYDIRLFEADTRTVIASKRLALSDRGDGTWQIGGDERLDPVYNNDPVEIHQRLRNLDWRAAAAISRYVAGVLSGDEVATTDAP